MPSADWPPPQGAADWRKTAAQAAKQEARGRLQGDRGRQGQGRGAARNIAALESLRDELWEAARQGMKKLDETARRPRGAAGAVSAGRAKRLSTRRRRSQNSADSDDPERAIDSAPPTAGAARGRARRLRGRGQGPAGADRRSRQEAQRGARRQGRGAGRYRSEFFGRLREVLGDRPDVRIVGDRFVFQSEVLFDTRSAELGDAGGSSSRNSPPPCSRSRPSSRRRSTGSCGSTAIPTTGRSAPASSPRTGSSRRRAPSPW